MIVKDLITGYRDSLEEEKLNPRTVNGYCSDIGIFLDSMGIRDSSPAKVLAVIKKSNVRKYLACGKASKRTQRRRYSSLSRFLTYCTPEITSSNPLDEIKPPKIEANPSFITGEEFDTLTESPPPYPNYKRSVYSHERGLSIMSLLFLDGFEISEILENTYEEITETEVEGFTEEKINAYQRAFFNTFGRHLSEEPDEKFYRNRFKKPISDESVRKNFSRMGNRVLGRDDINLRTIHNGYLKMRIDEIRAKDSEASIYRMVKETGAHFFTIQGLIKS